MILPTDGSSQSSGDAHTEIFDKDVTSGATMSSPDGSTRGLESLTFSPKPGPRVDLEVAGLFTENVAAKIWRSAANLLAQEVSYNAFSGVTSTRKIRS